jgi:hypothetical protein
VYGGRSDEGILEAQQLNVVRAFGKNPVVEIETDHGVLTVRLWADSHEEEATHIIRLKGCGRTAPAF